MLEDSKVVLPDWLKIPENFIYEKMIYEIAGYYGINPKTVESGWDLYDYYEHLIFKIHKQKTEEYLYTLAKENK